MIDKADLRVALIGTGFMGRLHSIAYAIFPSFFPDLPAPHRQVVVDVSEDLAKRGARQFGYDEWAVGWEDIVARDDIDIVDIVTPNDSHRPIAERAVAAGKHVLCEKPLALTAEEARMMSESTVTAPGVNMVAFNYRRCPAVLQAKRLINEGSIGKVLSFRALYLQDWAMREGTPWTWRFGAAESGSGALGDIGSHALDLACYLVGEIEAVAGAAETFVRSRARPGYAEAMPVDVDDCTIALLRFRNGALGTVEASRFAYGRKNFLTFEISGSNGALAFDWERCNELLFYSATDRDDVQGFHTIVVGPHQPNGELFWPIPGIGTAFIETQILQTGAFVRAIAEGSKVDTDFAHGYRIQNVMEHILAAAKNGRWMAIAPDLATG